MAKDNKAEPTKSDVTELDEIELEDVTGGFFGSLVKRAARVIIKEGAPGNAGKNLSPGVKK